MSQSGTPADAPAEQDTETPGQAVTDRDAVPAAPAASTTNVPTGEEFTSVARQLFLGHPLPMWVCDVETLRIVEVNDAAIETYGYARAEFLAMRVTDFRPPEDVERSPRSHRRRSSRTAPACTDRLASGGTSTRTARSTMST